MKKGKMIRVENDIVTIGMNNGSIKEVRRCDLGFDPVLGDLVEIFEDEDQIIVTKAKKEPENHNDAGININMTNSINNASDVAAGNGKKVVNKVAFIAYGGWNHTCSDHKLTEQTETIMAYFPGAIRKDWIVDQKAHDEQVVIGYQCSCGDIHKVENN